jgi:4-hydroxyproline epimerase
VIEIERSIRVIDSHTGGEPTRTVIEGGPDLGNGSLAQRRDNFRELFDTFRSTVVNEPRGSDVIVGALLCKPSDPSCEAGVIFFNNVGYLGMCGHGTIGVVVTLAYLKRITPGVCKLETPVGIISATLGEDGLVSVRNVPSYRFRKDVTVEVEGVGPVTGDVAWSGNWFFLVGKHRETLRINNVERLTDVTWRIRNALTRNNITGKDGAEIDHIELFSAPESTANHSRNFVLCPGKAYDRSPCGTGTSAKIACLAADGKLKAGETWRQESIIGSVFEGFYEMEGDLIIPTIRGSAYITGDCTLLLQKNDPLQQGIRQ